MTTPKKLLTAGAAGLAAGALAGGLALASSTPTLKTADNASLGETIVVDGRGMTVYELRPETAHHLLCKKSNGCLKNWPPVTVKSRHAKVSAAHGIKGKLAVLHRDGVFQVTLSGHPLYRFAGDSARGDANGQGLHAFGGTWHVVAIGASTPATTPTETTPSDTTPTDTTPASTTPSVCYYPGYC